MRHNEFQLFATQDHLFLRALGTKKSVAEDGNVLMNYPVAVPQFCIEASVLLTSHPTDLQASSSLDVVTGPASIQNVPALHSQRSDLLDPRSHFDHQPAGQHAYLAPSIYSPPGFSYFATKY